MAIHPDDVVKVKCTSEWRRHCWHLIANDLYACCLCLCQVDGIAGITSIRDGARLRQINEGDME